MAMALTQWDECCLGLLEITWNQDRQKNIDRAYMSDPYINPLGKTINEYFDGYEEVVVWHDIEFDDTTRLNKALKWCEDKCTGVFTSRIFHAKLNERGEYCVALEKRYNPLDIKCFWAFSNHDDAVLFAIHWS